MTDDTLMRILRAADESAAPPPVAAPDLARRVRLAAPRRRGSWTAVRAAAAMLLAIGAASQLWSRPAPLTSQRPGTGESVARSEVSTSVEELISETELLRQEAELQLAELRTARQLAAIRREAAEDSRGRVATDPIVGVRKEVEKAAFVLVSQADRMCFELKLCDVAVVKYRRVLDLFPDTPSAAIARKRIADIEQNKGDLS